MAKLIAAEKAKAGLRHAVVSPNVTGRTKKRIAHSKRARAGSLALVELATSGANMYPPGVWFCFIFVFMLSLKPRPLVQSSFDMQAPR